jgi:hypothetical protein
MIVMLARPSLAQAPAVVGTDPSSNARAAVDSATPDTEHLIEAGELARLLSEPGHRPTVLHVGPAVLFRQAHITGSRHVGPASTPEGLHALQQALGDASRGTPIVLYCGCCPWADCPNVRPALKLVQELGRNDVKVLYLPRNLRLDWIDQGLPTSRGGQ